MYGQGRSEKLTSEAIKPFDRSKLYLIDKVLPQNASHQRLEKSLDRSLKLMQTDYFDLYLLHWRGGIPLAETVDELVKMQTKGKIRHWGVSNFDVADEIKMYMANEESAVAVTFSGEAAEMLENNEHLHYVIPSEGSNLWFDNIVMPKTAKNKEGAYAFMNFMLRPENAAQNAEYIGYSTPNKEAKKLLPKEVAEDKQFYPDDETIKHLEVYQDLGQEYLGIYNDLFLEFKMYRK